MTRAASRTGRSIRGSRTARACTFQIDLVRCLWTVLPAAILWGASFPLALAAAGRNEEDPARLVGTVYAANTIGGIVGALFGSLLIIAWLGHAVGAAHSHRVAGDQRDRRVHSDRRAARSEKERRTGRGCSRGRRQRRHRGVARAISVPPVPPLLVGYGRWFASRLANENDFIYMGEGMVSSVAVSQLPNGVLNYHNAGKVQASSEPQDMRLQRMLGHLTTLLPPNAELACSSSAAARA